MLFLDSARNLRQGRRLTAAVEAIAGAYLTVQEIETRRVLGELGERLSEVSKSAHNTYKRVQRIDEMRETEEARIEGLNADAGLYGREN